MNIDEQAAFHADQLALQHKVADIIINAYAESSMTFDQLKVLVAACGLNMLDLDPTIAVPTEKEFIANVTQPQPYTEWTNPNF